MIVTSSIYAETHLPLESLSWTTLKYDDLAVQAQEPIHTGLVIMSTPDEPINWCWTTPIGNRSPGHETIYFIINIQSPAAKARAQTDFFQIRLGVVILDCVKRFTLVYSLGMISLLLSLTPHTEELYKMGGGVHANAYFQRRIMNYSKITQWNRYNYKNSYGIFHNRRRSGK